MQQVKKDPNKLVLKNLTTANQGGSPVWCFAASLFLSGIFALGVNQLKADYIYEANQNLINLTGESGTTSLNAGDDQLSSAFNLDFAFDFYGEDFLVPFFGEEYANLSSTGDVTCPIVCSTDINGINNTTKTSNRNFSKFLY